MKFSIISANHYFGHKNWSSRGDLFRAAHLDYACRNWFRTLVDFYYVIQIFSELIELLTDDYIDLHSLITWTNLSFCKFWDQIKFLQFE